MPPHRFTVVQRQKFENQLAEIWLQDPDEVQRSMDELEPVLRTLPDQAGHPFYFDDELFWFIQHRAVEILYRISEDDCQVQLISIRHV